MIILTMF
jgi:hypothetical protein